MAATTTQLGLVTPTQGDLSGTWGDTVNNGITEYTNIAIAGTLTLTGDGAVTMANTTGDASASNITSSLAGAGTVTAQFAIVNVSGTTTTNRSETLTCFTFTYPIKCSLCCFTNCCLRCVTICLVYFFEAFNLCKSFFGFFFTIVCAELTRTIG